MKNTELAPVELRAQKGQFTFGVEFLIFTETHDAEPVMFTRRKEDEGSYRGPTFTLDEKQAQVLMDDLWRIGLRPSSGEGNVGQIGALKDHLNDMRRIAFTVFGGLNSEEE